MGGPLYTAEILRLATQIPHLGLIPDLDMVEGPHAREERRTPICGSRIIVDVVLDEQGRVRRFAHDVKACAMGQASASLLGQNVIGASGDELSGTALALRNWLKGDGPAPAWPGLTLFEAARAHPARHPAICLAFEAAAAAVEKALASSKDDR